MFATYVDDVSLLLSDNLEVPLPHLCSNWLTDTAQDSQVLHLVLDKVVASTLQKSQSGRSNVELCDLVLGNNVPVSAEIGVCGSTLENDGCNTQQQGCVDDVCVTSNPTNITTAEEDVLVVDVENVLARGSGTQEVTTSRVHNTLGLSGGARCVEKEEGVFGVHGLGGNVVGVLLDLLVPPQITALSHGHICTSALVHQTVLDVRALAEGVVDNLLGANELAATSALISGDDDLGVCVDDAVLQRVG